MAMTRKSTVLQSWSLFINNVFKQPATDDEYFPKRHILSLMSKQECPSLKQLLMILPQKHSQYRSEPSRAFRQIIILLYIIMVKGCNNRTVYEITEEILTELLRYRVVLIVTHQGLSQIAEVYYYLDSWLDLMVPKMLVLDDMIERILTNCTQNGLMGMTNSRNKGFKEQNIRKIDNLIITFHIQLISKVSSQISTNSLDQFKMFLQQIYPYEYLDIINKALNTFTMTPNSNQKNQINIQHICYFREGEHTPFIQNLSIIQNQDNLKLLCPSTLQLSQQHNKDFWVVQAYYQQPQQISDLLLNLQKQSIMQIYNFLMRMEIYGGSPKIQILNDFLISDGKTTDYDADDFLQFFSDFLMGQKFMGCEYQYGDSQRKQLLEVCLNKIRQLSKNDQIILVQELATQICNNKNQ